MRIFEAALELKWGLQWWEPVVLNSLYIRQGLMNWPWFYTMSCNWLITISCDNTVSFTWLDKIVWMWRTFTRSRRKYLELLVYCFTIGNLCLTSTKKDRMRVLSHDSGGRVEKWVNWVKRSRVLRMIKQKQFGGRMPVKNHKLIIKKKKIQLTYLFYTITYEPVAWISWVCFTQETITSGLIGP